MGWQGNCTWHNLSYHSCITIEGLRKTTKHLSVCNWALGLDLLNKKQVHYDLTSIFCINLAKQGRHVLLHPIWLYIQTMTAANYNILVAVGF
jgi:hypothetical protein